MIKIPHFQVLALSPGKTFLFNASKLMAGTVLAQAITFGLSFVLARLYAPAEFGHYSIFAGAAGVLAAASTGAMDRAIVLARSDEEARRAGTVTLLLSLTCAVGVSLVGLIATTLGLTRHLPLSALDIVVFVPVFMISYAGTQVLNASCLRQDRIGVMAGLKVAQSLTIGIVQVLASSSKSAPGMIIGTLAGWVVMLVAGIRWHTRHGLTRRDLDPRRLVSVLRRYWRYPRYVMPNELIDNLSNQVPLILIGSIMSLSIAGHYGLALTMLSAPTAVMGRAVGQAFLQHIGRHRGEPQALRQAMFSVWTGMAVVGIVPFGLILAMAPRIFDVAFGDAWIEAGVVAQHLAILLFVRFVSSPTSSIYLKLEMQREQSWFAIAAAIYRTASYALAVTGLELTTIIIIHVTFEIVAIVAYNLLALHRLAIGTRTP